MDKPTRSQSKFINSGSNLRFSGNLILEIDDKPAMPYLLSVLPIQTEQETLNSIPLVAKIPCTDPLNSLNFNVLGGSTSRGGIALDPLVASGRLYNGAKVEFGQLRQSYLASVKYPRQGVHIQLECISPMSRRWEPENQKWGKYKRVEEGFERQQRYTNFPDLTYSKRLEYQGLQKGLFSAGSEGGFLVGTAGLVPWLVRTPGSRLIQPLMQPKKGHKLSYAIPSPSRRFCIKRHEGFVRQRAQLREFLKARQLVLSKRAVPTQTISKFPPWTTIPYLRPASRFTALTDEQKALREERQQIRDQYRRERRNWKAREKLKVLEQFKNHPFRRPQKPKFPPEPRNFHGLTYDDLPPYLQGLFQDRLDWDKYIPKVERYSVVKINNAQRKNCLRILPKYIRDLIRRDPAARRFIEDRSLSGVQWFNSIQTTGQRRFGFRARARWVPFGKGGFKRRDHQPGGLSLTLRKGRRNLVGKRLQNAMATLAKSRGKHLIKRRAELRKSSVARREN